MSMIQVKNLTFTYDGSYEPVFENASFQIDTGWRLGLIGRNGRGKTTLLRLLCGTYPYQGTISVSTPVSYFPYLIRRPEAPAIDAVSEMEPDYELWRLQCEMEKLRLDESILLRPYATLSGGEQTKLQLAVLFSSEQHYLLIDEPTNHLDLPGRELVSRYLSRKRGFLLVSHDRAFLDGCVDHILSINRADIQVCRGNFSTWMENRERQEAVARINEEKLSLEARRNQADKQAREKNSELLNLEREVSVLEQRKAAAALEEKTLLDKLWETYELSHEAARAQRVELESVPKAQRRVGELKKAISGLGNINLDAIEEFQRINERYTYLTDQRDDVLKSKKELEGIIADITEEMKTIFARQFSVINEAFQQTFTELFGGGKATLELEEPEDILNCGIEIRVQPPGKALKVLSLLSGGEKAFVAIALYFAILKVRPTPFCVMDEIEAALDDANVVRFARYMRQMADKTQFIVITHRRGTMEEADVLYGVTMQEQGVSRILTINLNDVEKELHIK